jgi:hypothetical protein
MASTMAASVITVPTEQLRRAVDLRRQIESLDRELQQLLRSLPVQPFDAAARQRKFNLTPEGKARIAAAQRLRWARFNASRNHPHRPVTRHLLSPEGRARVSAAVKARWERYRAAKAALPAR